MMALGVVGKRFADAGLKDTLIQSGVVAEGFIESVMTGKMYNRAIRANKLVYEALLRMLLEKFQNQQSVTSYTEEINQLHQNLDQETYQSILRNECFTSYYNEFEIFLDKLTEDNPLAELWLSYINMMTIILLYTQHGLATGSYTSHHLNISFHGFLI